MYARNKKLQKLGINDVADYKPTEWTGKVWISGREFDQNDKIKVRIDGEEKEIKVPIEILIPKEEILYLLKEICL